MTFDPDRWLTQLRTCQHLPESDMKLLCDHVRSILMEESNIQPVSSPVTICGDIHGQFWDLLELLRKGGEVPETSYVFMARPCSSLTAYTVLRWRFGIRVISWTADIIVSRPFLCCWSSKRCERSPSSFRSPHVHPSSRYPHKVTLLRGNHESRQITQVYGFYGESHSSQSHEYRHDLAHHRRMPTEIRQCTRVEGMLQRF